MKTLPTATAEHLVLLLQSARLDLSSEKHLQEGVETLLTGQAIRFEREKRLSSSDIPDFLVEGGVVLECKMRNKASKMQIYRQLVRYAGYQEVSAIVLASNVAMGLPSEIAGKPLYAASLSRGWM